MKKKITGKKIAILLLALVLLMVGGFCGWRMLRKKGTLKNENYIASNFLEMGLYPKGRSIASQALSTSPNDISRQLLLLSFCYEEDFENALSYGEKYLKKSDADLTDEIYQYALEAESSGADTVQLLLLHNKVKEQLQVSTGDSVRVSAAQDILQMESGADADTLSENLELLEGANDALSLKAKAYGNALLGNTAQAASYATQLVQTDNSLSNQTAAANAIVAAYSTVGTSEDDAEMLALTQKAQELSEEIYELEEQLSEQTRNGKNTESVEKKLEKANEQRDEVYEEISALPARRALNYMEANKPWKEQAGYWIQLARLYYLMGEEDTAQEYINRVLSESISGEDTGYLGPEISKLLSAYDTASGTGSGEQDSSLTLEEAAEAVNYGLTQGFVTNDTLSGGFTDFLVQTVREYREVLVISRVDAREFPQIDVYLTTDLEDGLVLEKEDLAVYEMGVEIMDFELVDLSETEQELSICFVMDVSGSMQGTALENAKSAAGNFLTMLEGCEAQVGLATFSGSAQIVSQLTESTGILSKGIDSLYADGGTSIASGLKAGMEVLQSATGLPVIILLSDGADGDAGQIEAVKTQLQNQGITVYAVGVGGADGEYLQGIADATGGIYINAEDSANLGAVYRQISQYILQGYMLRLTVTEDTDNYERNVKVQWKQDAYDKVYYTVGVSEEDILLEETEGIRTDFYVETGGSGKEASEDGQ